jgi:hypothetical protein
MDEIEEIQRDGWREFDRTARAVNRLDDPDAPTGPLTPGQIQCAWCQLDDRTRAATDPVDQLCHVCRSSGDARLGHQFHFQVMVQGAYRGTDGFYHDGAEPVEYEPFTLTVRAWDLPTACRRAAETPLADWKHAGEEQ